MHLKHLWILALIAAIGLSACAAPPTVIPIPPPTQAVTLTPYTSRVRPTPTRPAVIETDSSLPSPSPTPLTHTVNQGEDLFGIALRYGLTVEDLKAANPDVDPNLLSIGTVLVIPGGGPPMPTPTNPTPTPFPLQLSSPDCWPAADGSLTCFVLASNPGSVTLENLSVLFRSVTDSGDTIEQEAYGLLNLLPPGERLPLLVLFPASHSSGGRAAVALLSAFPLPEGDSRYTPVDLQNVEIEIAPDGKSAVVRGEVVSQGAQTAWIAAWAMDTQGRMVAARRWEAPAALASGTGEPFTILLYSLGGQISVVQTLAEARQ
jgi:LysM repeat protein